MRNRPAVIGLLVSLVAAPAGAQTPTPKAAQAPELVPPPSWAFTDLACAPAVAAPANLPEPPVQLRVVGSQDTIIKDMFGPGDTLIISGGSNAGLQQGQRFYVRRVVRSFGIDEVAPTIQTAGWIQILGVDTTIATATIVQACDGVLVDDYLEPFEPPTVAAMTAPGTAPHYENMGHILTGKEGMRTGGLGQLMTIDRGGKHGVVAGQRFLVFRDKRTETVQTTDRSDVFAETAARLPLVEIGRVLVVAVRPEDATVQILSMKDAISTGDLVAPIN